MIALPAGVASPFFHQPTLASTSNQLMSAHEQQASFLHAIICCHDKSTDSVMCLVSKFLDIMNVRKYIAGVWRLWNFMAIKHMCKRLKPDLFSSSSGLGTRLIWDNFVARNMKVSAFQRACVLLSMHSRSSI